MGLKLVILGVLMEMSEDGPPMGVESLELLVERGEEITVPQTIRGILEPVRVP
jgi:hypothetical protein